MVYVISKEGKPLMPTKRHGKVRRWLKDRKAKVVKHTPFTIQLLFETGNITQDLNLGIDPGSKKVGTAVRRSGTREILYSSEVTLRTDITRKLKQRASYRRTRRNRKTRYRKPRFLNRTRSEGWLPPSVQSKIDSTKKEIDYILSILPITRITFEYSKFDIHKLKNTFVKGFWYQLGDMYGYESTKAYVLERDNYKCQTCKGKKKDKRLQIHHVIYRRNGGTNKPSNLLTLCSTCHDLLHAGKLVLTNAQLKSCTNTVDATQVSIISKRIWEYLQSLKPDYILAKTYGYSTKVKRKLLKIGKSHILDAVAISYGRNKHYRKGLRKPRVTNNFFYNKICVSKGDYQQTKGQHSEKKIPTGKIQGFRKFDVVKYLNKIYSIKGRMSSGYAFLMGEDQKKIELKPIPKLENLVKVQARNSWVVI